MVPVVDAGTDDDHRAAPGLVRVLGEFAGQAGHLGGRHAGYGFLPGRRIGLGLVVACGAVVGAAATGRGQQAPVDAVVGGHQVEHRHRQHAAAIGQLQTLGWHMVIEHVAHLQVREVLMLDTAEVGEADPRDFVMATEQ